MLRGLASLRDAGVISDAEFQAKKDELLTRI
jgi:Short C-terminal domain